MSDNVCYLRRMAAVDLPEVMEIEQLSFRNPWTVEEFRAAYHNSLLIKTVAEYRADIVGYIVYATRRATADIINLAVHPSILRRHIGSYLLDSIRARPKLVTADVSEANLEGQLFFRSRGYRATEVIRSKSSDGSAAYHFERRPEAGLLAKCPS